MTRHTHISQRFLLDGKVARITGASKSIGATMAMAGTGMNRRKLKAVNKGKENR